MHRFRIFFSFLSGQIFSNVRMFNHGKAFKRYRHYVASFCDDYQIYKDLAAMQFLLFNVVDKSL